MIDIHCHILPNMDDGAQSMAEALEMARLAVQSGVTDIIATPHFPADMLQEKLPQLTMLS
jgi:protein-tyrosine phosphatase